MYYLPFFKALRKVISTINYIQRNFLWVCGGKEKISMGEMAKMLSIKGVGRPGY